MNKKKGFSLKAIYVIIFVTAIVTSLTTSLIIYNNSKIILGAASITDDDALKEFLRVYNGLGESYYEEINKTEMIDAAISGMLEYLGEAYSTYMDQNETDDLAQRLSGTFKGIGISIGNGREIVKVHTDTPASKAGLQEGDIILNINGTNTENLTQAAVANLIDKTKQNIIVISRGNTELTFQITPEIINTPLTSQILEMEEKKVGYIYFSSFTNTVGTEFQKSLRELEELGMTSLIIDVRSNAGGYLKGASEIANLFLEKDKVIYTLEGKDSTETFRDDTDENRTIPVIILVNEGTASASEVLASALKDSYGATIIGGVTYGKGKVQQTKSLEDGSMVKYTIARWLRPNGECIDEIGIQPDYLIKIEEDENGVYKDTQLEKALELAK